MLNIYKIINTDIILGFLTVWYWLRLIHDLGQPEPVGGKSGTNSDSQVHVAAHGVAYASERETLGKVALREYFIIRKPDLAGYAAGHAVAADARLAAIR